MDRILRAIQSIQSWLLGTEVQITRGPHCGAVVGWFDEKGTPQFLYPEITGYYLSWLSYLAQSTGQADDALCRTKLALSWLAKYLSADEKPQTRIYLEREKVLDWRNGGCFSFDFAMLVRGVASAIVAENETLKRTVLEQLFERLLPFCDQEEGLQAFRPHAPDGVCVPNRWSCSRGPQQTKVAAAILSSNTMSQVPARLLHASNSVYKHWRRYDAIPGPDGAHAAFYHLEGLALAAVNGWDREAPALLESGFRRIISMQDSFERSDVVAQALRVGCILCNGRSDSDLVDRLKNFAVKLEQFTSADGGVLFSNAPSFRHKNVWSAIFAHQALCFYEVIASGNSLDNHLLRLLI